VALYEREKVIDAAAALLDEVRKGRGGALFIVGEAGLGKTAVLEEMRRLASADVTVGLGRADPMEASVPFGLFTQAASPLGVRHVVERRGPEEFAADLRAESFFGSLRALEAQATSPVLVAFDDLQWSDPDTLALLFFLCRRIAGLPVAVIGSLRPWPPAAEEMAVNLARTEQAVVERLAPLSEAAAGRLLSARIGRKLPDETERRAWSLCAGNPLLLEQIARAVARGESIPDVDAGWSLKVPEALLLSRFSGLPVAAIRLAQAASIFGVRCRPDIAIEVAQLTTGEADTGLDALYRSGLVYSSEEGSLEFTHSLFGAAVYHDLAPPIRARLHARAFAALARRGMEAGAAEHAISGNLVGEPEAIEVLQAAGRQALDSGAGATAVKQLEAATELAGGRAGPQLLLMLGEALLANGRAGEAIRVYETVLARNELETLRRAEALRMLGRALFLTGALSRAGNAFHQAAQLAAVEDATEATLARLDEARAAWMLGGPARGLPIAEQARQLSTNAEPSVRTRAEGGWGFIAYIAGDPLGLQASLSAAGAMRVDPLTHLSDLWWSWDAGRDLGRVAKFAERFEEAETISAAALQLAEQHHIPPAIASLATYHAEMLVRLGRLEDALALLGKARSLNELAPLTQPMAMSVQALALMLVGRLDESDECREAVERLASGQDQWLPWLWTRHIRAWRKLVEGHVDQACELYALVHAASRDLGIGEPCMVPWARLGVAAFVRAGAVDAARDVVSWLSRCADRLPCRWPRIALAGGRAELAQAEGDGEGAEAHLRTALQLCDGLELPLERYQSLFAYGSWLRRTGQPNMARPVLTEALRLAERTGATWLADQARGELTVAGGRPRRERDPHTLTLQEERVAQLAAEGLSNHQIASRLSVSVKTVETHLLRIYSKLGITSRRQLILSSLAGGHPVENGDSSGGPGNDGKHAGVEARRRPARLGG
jgi:DNA-binding CsgD family transcriptional regulator